MLRIALSTLRARKGGAIGAWTAVALAVVLVTSTGILLESSLRAPLPVERLDGAGVVVRADQTLPPQDGRGSVSVVLPEQTRLPASLVARLRAVPGVRAAVADRTFSVEVVDGRGRLLTVDGAVPSGHGWSSAALTPLRLTSGHAPRGPGEVVLDSAVAAAGHVQVGDRLRVAGRPVTVAGMAPAAPDHPSVFFRDDVAVRLSGTGGARADLIGLVTEPGADPEAVATRVREALDDPHLRVLTGAKRGEAESLDGALAREDIVAGLTVFGVLAAFVAIFVVASTFALSVQQRHRELALFRAIGSTPRQVRRMVAGEALVLALLAFAAGAPAGVAFAYVERSLFAKMHMLPADLDVVVGWLPFAAALVAALVTTQLAAFASARRASKVRPVDALREASVQRRPLSWLRGLSGLAALGGGVAVVGATAGGDGSDAPAATMVLMVAAALLAPLLALPFVWLLGLPLQAFGRGPGLLASANARANLRRVASVASPLILTVALASTILVARTTLERQAAEQAERSIRADHVLVAGEGRGLRPEVAAGLGHASGTLGTSVAVADGGGNLALVAARGVDPATLGGVVDLGFTSGSPAALRGDALAVSTTTARNYGWHVGERVKLWLGDGTPARLRVAGIYERPLGFGEIVLPRPLLRAHVTDDLDDAVFVAGRVPRTGPGVEALTRSQYLGELEAKAREQSLVVYVLLGIVVLFSAIAVVNALTMAIAERGRELALLRLVGATRRQLTRMIRAETLVTVVFGLAIGTLVAAPPLAVFSHGLTGSAVPTVPAWLYGAVLLGSTALALAAAVLPTRLALRTDPVSAMGAHE